jgi:hypothetical protein
MEQSGRNRRQPLAKMSRRNPLSYLRPVADACHRLRQMLHGKEHVRHRLPWVADNPFLVREMTCSETPSSQAW